MKKPKIVKMSLSELLQKEQAGKIKLLGNKQKIQQQSIQALNRLKKGNPGFNCKNCGTWFKPQPDQWIFHQLCDTCFAVFDRQKMMGRYAAMIEKKPVEYFEDADDWIQHTTN